MIMMIKIVMIMVEVFDDDNNGDRNVNVCDMTIL